MPANREDRILSLLASATEIVCALGLRERLVGRSHECDFPPSVLQLPQATRPRFDVGASSASIDRQVKRLASEAREIQALGVYEVLPGLLRRLRPTHIVTQVQCDVCAVSYKDVQAAVRRESAGNPEIVSLQPDSLDAIWQDFRRVGQALGVPREGDRLVERICGRIEAIRRVARGAARRPSVAAIEWADPLMAAGNWTPELIEMAGGQSLFGTPGHHSPWLDFGDLARADPDIIIVMPCGYGLARTLADVSLLERRHGWERLRAVTNGAVYAADGNQYFNRPGPRLAESAEILAEILHPGHFDFGHEGTGWQRVSRSAKGPLTGPSPLSTAAGQPSPSKI
ncbi:MAG: cobalamin-binding protein [Bryobacterales bacterium]|nr:cobalamin-binding protein [Bryobacterales bacterium]